MVHRRTLFARLGRLGIAALALTASALGSVQAQIYESPKISTDLKAVAKGGTASQPNVTWAKVMGAGNSAELLVKVLIFTRTNDVNAALSSEILKTGSVFYNYVSVSALSAMVPARQLDALASRTDVLSIAPNRVVARSASLLQDASGAGPVLPVLNGGTGSPGLNGAGVGIAILDSGIDYNHPELQDANGKSRVLAAVDMLAVGTDL